MERTTFNLTETDAKIGRILLQYMEQVDQESGKLMIERFTYLAGLEELMLNSGDIDNAYETFNGCQTENSREGAVVADFMGFHSAEDNGDDLTITVEYGNEEK